MNSVTPNVYITLPPLNAEIPCGSTIHLSSTTYNTSISSEITFYDKIYVVT